MIGILLMILKLIGLFLLGILGLFLVLVLLLLFLPVPYRIWVSGDSDGSSRLEFRVKLFGIQVVPRKEHKQRAKKKSDDKQSGHSAEDEVTQIPEKQSEAADKESLTSAEPQVERRSDAGPTKTEKRASGKKRFKHKEKRTSGRDIRSTVERLRAEFTDERNRRALRHLISEIRYLLHYFGPRRVRADVSFSLGDPANTGYATAALSVCPFVYGKDCCILPDFEAEQIYLRGWLDVKGHVRMIHVLLVGLRLLFDRDIRIIIQKVRKK